MIGTARTLEAINDGARAGFRPVVEPVVPSGSIHHQVAVYQDQETGLIEVVGDTRRTPNGTLVVPFRHYYPYHFPAPFAAYLVPADIRVGEEVWLEDVIEDIVAVRGNQGYRPRLSAAPARWTGSRFEILFDSDRDAPEWIG